MRSILNDWTIDYDLGLEKLGWTRLRVRRLHLKLLQLYKYYHEFAFYPPGRLARDADTSLRRSQRLAAPHRLPDRAVKKDSFRQSFEYSTIRLWNALPSDIALGNFNKFKAHITCMKTLSDFGF